MNLFLYCQFPTLPFSLSLSHLSLSLSLSPFNVTPLMKSGGSVIFSIVPWVTPLPSSSRSSQNSAGPTDRNSLPCRYQSPPLLTIILICLSLSFSLPKPQRFLPTLRKQGFPVIVTGSWTCRFLCAGFSAMWPARPGARNYSIFYRRCRKYSDDSWDERSTKKVECCLSESTYLLSEHIKRSSLLRLFSVVCA